MGEAPSFEWNAAKDAANRAKHGVPFALAQYAFFDPRRVIAEDLDPRRGRGALFLLRPGGRSRHDGAFYLSGRGDQNFWRWLLAERKADL